MMETFRKQENPGVGLFTSSLLFPKEMSRERVESGLARSFYRQNRPWLCPQCLSSCHIVLDPPDCLNVWYSVNGERLGTYMGYADCVVCGR